MLENNLLSKKSSPSKRRTATLDIVLIAMSAALISVCSWISIPTTIPFTLQTFAVFTTAGLLGMKRSCMAVFVYMLIGAIGAPVFAGFTGGLGTLSGPTGGYIVGFIFIALITGFASDKFNHKLVPMMLSMLLGLIICYAFGTVWYVTVYERNTGAIGIGAALSWCVIPYIIPDCIKISCACAISNRLGKYVKY